MLFSALGYLLRPVGRAGLWAGKHVGRLAWRGATNVGGIAAYGARAAAPHVAQAAATAVGDTVRGSVRAAPVAWGGLKGLYRFMVKKAPEGRALSNMFTGRQLRNHAVLGLEVASIGYAISKSDQALLSYAAQPTHLPAMTRSGHMPEVAQYTYDPLMGARGGMAFALHRLRHG